MTILNAIPFDGVEINSSTWREFQQRFLAPLHTGENGDGLVYLPRSGDFKVSQRAAGANMSVDVAGGAAWAAGLSVWGAGTTYNLPISAAHATFTRYDMVCIRADHVSKEVRLVVKEGTPSSSPVEPVMDKSGEPYHEIPLARVTVGPGVSQITNANIDDRREFIGHAPGVMRWVKNVSGQTMLPGHIVAWNGFSPIEVTFSTTPADPNTAGCMATLTPNNSFGLMTVYGAGLVRLAELKGTGTRVGTSSAAGLAQENALNWIATLLEFPNAVGYAAKCWIDLSHLKEPTITLIKNIREETTLQSFAYMNNMSATFFMRRPGKVMITCRGVLTQAGTTPSCELAAALDAATELCYRGTSQGIADQRGYFSFTHVFDNVHSGQHTAGLKWRVTGPGMTGYLEGAVFPATLQIEVL